MPHKTFDDLKLQNLIPNKSSFYAGFLIGYYPYMGCNSNLERMVKMTIYKNLGKKIKKMRLSQGLSQEQLAEDCSLSASYISCIERGTKKANLEKLEKLSNRLDFIIDIHPRTAKNLERIDSELISFLSNCSTCEKDFFNKAMKFIIRGIEANHLDW